MRFAALLLALPVWGLDVTYSKQADVIPAAYVGRAVKGVAIYRAQACNTGTGEERFFPARIGFEASKVAPQQDPTAALFAAREYKSRSKLSVITGALIEIAPYAGLAMPLLGSLGVAIPDWAIGVGGGTAGITTALQRYNSQATHLEVPANWLLDGMPERILQPGQCEAFMLALGGKPPLVFNTVMVATTHPTINASAPEREQAKLLLSSTHPQIAEVDEMEEVHQYAEKIAALIRERSAQIGAQQ
tara:strand:+ start:1816 stop:2553 length:738 start_codon:yes stop_codon:yes gene_type:complete